MEFTDYLRFFAALAFVVGLIGMLALGARRFGMTPRITRKRGQRGSRLSIVDMMPVDGKRRLVLLRRDNVEHLVMLGPTRKPLSKAGSMRSRRGVQGPRQAARTTIKETWVCGDYHR